MAGAQDRPLAVVVGAGAMGLAVAVRLSQSHRVLLADLDGDKASAIAATLDGATGLACDVTTRQGVAALAEAVGKVGGWQAWVQVAGLSPSLGDYRTIMRVNLMGPARIAAALLPLARPGAAGVLIASLAAHSMVPDEAAQEVLREPEAEDLAERLATVLGERADPAMAYVHSKFGLRMLARRLASAWGAKACRIASLSPGLIATPQGALEFRNSPGKRKMFEKSPLAREGTMEEIADAVEFLTSDRARFISGTDLLVDGGLAAELYG